VRRRLEVLGHGRGRTLEHVVLDGIAKPAEIDRLDLLQQAFLAGGCQIVVEGEHVRLVVLFEEGAHLHQPIGSRSG
jgi:hypothetical protein